MACVPCHWTKYCLLCEASSPWVSLSLAIWNSSLPRLFSSLDCYPLTGLHWLPPTHCPHRRGGKPSTEISAHLRAQWGLRATEHRPSLLTVLHIWNWAPNQFLSSRGQIISYIIVLHHQPQHLACYTLLVSNTCASGRHGRVLSPHTHTTPVNNWKWSSSTSN